MDLPPDLQRFADWDWLASQVDEMGGLTDLEKEQAKRAFGFLGSEFGGDFLRQGFADRHPLPRELLNQAPWTRKWVAWFAGALEGIRECTGYESLLRRLKDSEAHAEGVTVLQAADRFARAGFTVSFDPAVEVEGSPREPDLGLVDAQTSEALFVEVSALKESEGSKKAWGSLTAVSNALIFTVPRLKHCGRLHKKLSKPHLDTVVSQVQAVCRRAEEERIFKELSIPGVIEIAVAPDGCERALEEWGRERELKEGDLQGPSSGSDEVHRTGGKIRQKQRQLPRTHPSIVVVHAYAFFFHADLDDAISELEEAVYEYPHLLTVAVVSGYTGGGREKVIAKGPHEFITRRRFGVIVDQFLLLNNQFCETKVSPGTAARVRDAFRLC